MTDRITGKPVRQTTFGALVDKLEGKERNKREIAYEFADGKRTFQDTGANGGPYKQP